MDEEANVEEMMNRLLSFVWVTMLAGVLAAGAGYAATMYQDEFGAYSGTSMRCALDFRDIDVGNKGYLTSEDLNDAYYPHGHLKGPAPVGKAYSLFYTYDTNRDERMSLSEYCAWKER